MYIIFLRIEDSLPLVAGNFNQRAWVKRGETDDAQGISDTAHLSRAPDQGSDTLIFITQALPNYSLNSP
jgi:hypothetical protein